MYIIFGAAFAYYFFIYNPNIRNNREFFLNQVRKTSHKLVNDVIEKENIDYYNHAFETNFNYLDFRRNLVTENIRLNDLVGKTILVGEIKIKVNDLCRPCKDLQNNLNQKNIIKEFLRRGGIRCEIMSSGKINIGDNIEIT